MMAPRVRVILGAAVFAYFVSVLERSSMGVASLNAAERFHVGAAALSSLAVAQLVVYAAMQIPTGLLLDRFGARSLIVAGSLLTGSGNLVVAIAPQMSLAVIGRMTVGLGDALVFVSMIRLINGWVPGTRATRYTQLFANIGQLGQIASAVPFAYLLGFAGWTPAFVATSSIAFAAAAIGLVLLKNEPNSVLMPPERRALQQLLENIRDPNTRTAFWVHFTLQSSGSSFILLWGYPFMVQGEGLPKPLAGLLLSSFVFIGFFVGPLLSHICITFPRQRHVLVTAIYALMVASWLVIFITPGTNPLWQIVLLVLSIGIGGPASMIAFDYSRTSIPLYRLGSTNGIINSGGFVASFSCMFLVGFILDAVHEHRILGAANLYSLAAFKLAFPVELVMISAGLVFFFIERTKTRGINSNA